jgi:cytochrome c oxidase cbb3-type subunit 2
MTTRTFFWGVIGTFALSWLGLAVVPFNQLGNMGPQVDEEAGEVYPIDLGGHFQRGRDVYVSQGCVYCHTQVVRQPSNGLDLERKWGDRPTVPRDYIYEKPVFGVARNGPDLANVGARLKDADWHYRHLYAPRSVEPESFMPSFRHLFVTRKIGGQPSVDALKLAGTFAPPSGHEVVPTPEAKALVGYLLSLDRGFGLKEAPAPKKEEGAK